MTRVPNRESKAIRCDWACGGRIWAETFVDEWRRINYQEIAFSKANQRFRINDSTSMQGFSAESVHKMKYAGAHLADADVQRERAILEAIEENQYCIAQELHDSVCQSLGGIRLSTAAIARKLRSAATLSGNDFAHLDDVAARAITDLHEMIRFLQPVVIEPEGLVPALQQLAGETSMVNCRLVQEGNPMPPDSFTASQLFRMARTAVKYVAPRLNGGVLTINLRETGQELTLGVHAEEPGFPSAFTSLECLFAWKLLKRQANAIGATIGIDASCHSFEVTLPTPPPGE